ncbi:MAG: hypothetical protein SV487_07785 [Thermodesulfobacteriota bacterium]|nr:hypothetical protein [Thermodesulfobacteriota bacterium]
MRKIFLFGMLAFLLIFPSVICGQEYNCEQGYPHVAKKNGTYDARKNDLWELAQDWVHFRNKILLCNRRGDQECVEKARRDFQDVNVWINDYPESHVSKAIKLAEDCL